MSGMAQVQRVFRTVAGALNEAGIDWALGASLMLWLKGLTGSAKDIDLVVPTPQAQRADACLTGLGKRLPLPDKAEYATAFFAKYDVDGIGIDLMAGFTIRRDAYTVLYPYDPVHNERLLWQDTQIALCPLEDWYILYQLMQGRETRVGEIEAYLHEHGVREDVLAGWKDTPLPETVQKSLDALPRQS